MKTIFTPRLPKISTRKRGLSIGVMAILFLLFSIGLIAQVVHPSSEEMRQYRQQHSFNKALLKKKTTVTNALQLTNLLSV